MSNETDKPNWKTTILKSVVRATAMVRTIWEEDQLRDMAADYPGGEQPHPEPWRIFARESGLAELVEAVEAAALDEGNTPLGKVTIDAGDWDRIGAAARRVREG